MSEPNRAAFFAAMRPVLGGKMTQAQVDGINAALAALFGADAGANLQPIDLEGVKLIQGFEGLHDGDKRTAILEPEMDPIGVWTLGWGYALFEDGRPLKGAKDKAAAFARWRAMYPAGMTLEDAGALMLDVIAGWTPKLASLVTKPLNQNQSSALISLAYNVGIGIKDGRKGDLADSGLIAAINAGRMADAADRFLDWKFAGGRVLPGLLRRRKAERALFLKPV